MCIIKSNVDRSKTAIARKKISVPTKYLYENNLLNGRILDYGCGKGFDFNFLKNNYNKNIVGYDKFQEQYSVIPEGTFDVVMCNYVFNAIEDPEERKQLLDHLKTIGKVIYVSVRSDIKSIKDNWTKYNDGYITSRNTFQKIYNTEILKNEFDDINIILNNSSTIIFKVNGKI